MKKAFFTKILALTLLATLVVSCNKYEEGANFSFRTAKNRLVNTWTMSKSEFSNGTSSTTNTGFTEMVVIFEKSGTFNLTYKYLGFPFDRDGSWEFNADKTSVVMSFDDNNEVQTWDLIRLKNKELKVEREDTNGTFTFEFTGA